LGKVILNRHGRVAVVDVSVKVPSTAVVVVAFAVAHFASTGALAIAAPVAAVPVRESVFAPPGPPHPISTALMPRAQK